MNNKVRTLLADILTYLILTICAMLFLIPVIWLISSSLKDNQQIFRTPPSIIPSPVVWQNYVDAVSTSGLPFGRFFLNSIFVAVTSSVGAVFSSCIVAYAFARLKWAARDGLFFVLIMTMVIPKEVIIVPRFVIYNQIGWVDTFWPLIAPSFFGVPLYIFMMRQFMRGIPKEMDEAATIDGCNAWAVLWRIIAPQCKPAIIAIIIYSVQGQWNDFLEPLIYLSSMDNFTLTLGLGFFKGQFGTQWGLLMAATVIVVLPVLVLFVVAQKHYIQGVVVSGVKG